MVPADLVTGRPSAALPRVAALPTSLHACWTRQVICGGKEGCIYSLGTGGWTRSVRSRDKLPQSLKVSHERVLRRAGNPPNLLLKLLRLWHHQYGVLGARSVRSRSPVHSGQCVISGRNTEELGPACCALCAVVFKVQGRVTHTLKHTRERDGDRPL